MSTVKGKFGKQLHLDYTTKIVTKVVTQTQHFEINYSMDSQLKSRSTNCLFYMLTTGIND